MRSLLEQWMRCNATSNLDDVVSLLSRFLNEDFTALALTDGGSFLCSYYIPLFLLYVSCVSCVRNLSVFDSLVIVSSENSPRALSCRAVTTCSRKA